jgi:hypothetical protein
LLLWRDSTGPPTTPCHCPDGERGLSENREAKLNTLCPYPARMHPKGAF